MTSFSNIVFLGCLLGSLIGVIRSQENPLAYHSQNTYKVVCYLGTWAYYRPGDGKFVFEDIDPLLCTHAVYAFAKLENNQITPFDPYLDLKENWGLAADDIDFIDWSNCDVREPPLTMHIKDKDLKEMRKEEQFPVLTFEEFPCHTQSVERCGKLISEVAMKVCGEAARDGYIRAKLETTKELPTFDNKGQYYSNTNIQYS
ncbi:hypothetical protein AVEN_246924-1 [Araneus ventricosus]|uniref:GH18 domain-containing protein n=1 Tax=Araneus ventricosus TaxID=182803 RepID=A0A4Y2HM91_ARAVE|nr:hypothetical protein AVEN_246924-1 [Araneus ventricosus]